MILGIDTGVLVHWLVACSTRHRRDFRVFPFLDVIDPTKAPAA